MQYGVTLPNLGGCGDPRTLAELAALAEEAGWDGVFVWDSVFAGEWDDRFKDDALKRATCDPWIALAAMAMRTSRVRIGTMVTPLSRRRPWKVARETVSLDHLSGGRLVLPVSLGWVPEGAFSRVSEETDRRTRAERLDEALEIIAGLWEGESYSFQGRHFSVDDLTFLPRPMQSPRIPVWVVGAWRRERSMRRALRWDGIIPTTEGNGGWNRPPSAQEIAAIGRYVEENRRDDREFDIVFEGNTSGSSRDKALARLEPYAEAGVTWWLEGVWTWLVAPEGLEGMRRRISQGPHRVE